MDSGAILQYTLAAATAVLTFFLAWLLWQFIAMLRDARSVFGELTAMIERVKDGMTSFEQFLADLRERVAKSGWIVNLLAKAAGSVVSRVKNKRKGKRSSNEATEQ